MSNYLVIISIEHLNQLIPALAAFEHNGIAACRLCIFVKPHIQFSATTTMFLKQMIENFPSLRVVLRNPVTFCEIAKSLDCFADARKDLTFGIIHGTDLFQNKHKRLIHNLPVILRAKLLKKKLKLPHVTHIYYAHDVSGDFWNQTLMQAYPQAKRFCYGDALGLVYSQKYFLNQMYSLRGHPLGILKNLAGRLKRTCLFPFKKKQLNMDHAFLALPCDPGKDVLNQYPFSIVSQENIKEVVKCLAQAIPDFQKYMGETLKPGIKPVCLLMLSNFTESKLTTLQNEIHLYKDILKQYADKNELVIIKPHPASNPRVLDLIIHALQEDYRIHLIDTRFRNLPIELAEILLKECKILSVSYSSISIPYIYEKSVTHALTAALIHRYFNKERLKWFLESNELYLQMIDALKHWDKKNILLAETGILDG